jgi:predicted transposase YdaD
MLVGLSELKNTRFYQEAVEEGRQEGRQEIQKELVARF